MNIILEKVNKSFGTLKVLNNLSLTFPEGETTCIMGPSGCGKTTLLHILLGLHNVDSGTIRGLADKTCSVVFQEDRLLESEDACTNIRLVTKSALTDEELRHRFQDIGLSEYENKPVAELSGGMKRRVAILRALAADSDLLIMDEPFKGLDEALKIQVMNYVKKSAVGKTLILVTHDPAEAAFFEANIISLT